MTNQRGKICCHTQSSREEIGALPLRLSKARRLRIFIGQFIPQWVFRLLRPDVLYYGSFPDWETACRQCRGYDSPDILKKVEKTVLSVLKGEAVFERDSVAFFQEEPNIPLIKSLLKIAEGKKVLNVLEFGGGLGSVYFQNRHFLSIPEIHWDIVEQTHFVNSGRRIFRDSPVLSFFDSMQDSMNAGKPDVILFSSVLQYLPDYKKILNEALQSDVPYILIDRTLFFCGQEKHRICVEKVPAHIYRGSYAVHIFESGELDSILSDSYQKKDQFRSYPETVHLKSPDTDAEYLGQFWKRKAT